MRNRDSSIKEGKMEVYQELTIFNVEGTIAELIDRMEKKLSAGWVRSKSSEERLREMQAFQYCCDVTIDDIVSELVAKKLKIFSAVANKSTGAAHPLDRRRWMDFLVEAHRSETDLSPSMLRRWMCEVEGWSEDIASELTCDYETSRELLNYYDTH